jgi:hypothetical protein
MSHGSLQLRRFRIAIRDGYGLENAAAYAGIGINEARLTLGSDAADPPPPETYELIGKTMKGHDMAKAAKQDQVIKPDFKLAVKYYREDIRPAQAKVGEFAQEQSTAYKAIKKRAHVNPAAAKMAFKLNEMEDDKRDDFLRSLYGLMQELKIGISADLVDQMADGDAPTMPKIEKAPVSLVTVN